ncbi:hypothetical protein BU23DRAFT_374098, partial [Bimuria novae-zelandiae CBS 107.79]
SRPRIGRPKLLSQRDERRALRIVRRNPRVEYAELQLLARGIECSRTTLYRMLKRHGIRN